MKIRNTIIAVLLLLVYTVSYSHNVVSHGLDFVSQKNLHHHKHLQVNISEGEPADDGYIAHLNHLDQNIYDLLICLLSDMPQTEDNCNLDYYIPTITESANNSKLNQPQMVAVLIAILVPTVENSTTGNTHYTIQEYFSPPIDGTPSRGPPSIS